MASIIFSGDRLRALRSAIQLGAGNATVASGAVDPTLTAPGISLSPGSLYLSTSTGKLYVKKTTTANDTNFDTIPQLTATLSANRVVVTDASGNIVTDAQLTYDSTTDTFTVVNLQTTNANISSLTASLPVKTDTLKNLVSSQIINADVDPAAAIALTKLATLTASRALESNPSGVISASAITSTELGYVSGVTSSIQTQIASKVSKAGDSMTGDLVMGGNKITSLGAPTAGTDAVNKAYADNLITGIKYKDPVRAISTANITLSAPQTIDGVSILAGDRVLVAGQTSAIDNGIYVAAAGAWTRSTDMAAGSFAASAAAWVEEGTLYADCGFTCTSNTGSDTVGTNNLTFVQFAGNGVITAGVGLSKTGNTLDVNLGAGIVELPTDEVGIDLYSASGLFLTVDGTTSSLVSAAQLAILIDGTTLSRSASGVKVAVGGITDTEVSASAAIAYSKLALTNSIVNADVATGAAIARSKLAVATGNTFATNDAGGVLVATAVTGNRALATDANGLPVASATTDTELGFVNGVTSAIQTQLNAKLALAGGTMSGNIAMGTNKLTGLGAGTTAGDSVRYEQVILTTGDNDFAADQSMGTFKLTDLGTPTAASDAATKAYVDGVGPTGSSALTLTAGQSVTPSATATHQVILVQGNAAGTTTLSLTPFGASPTVVNGQVITLVGNSSTNLIQISNNDASKGCVLNSAWVGGQYDTLTLVYQSTQDRFVEISRNN